jgi:hypothetical protein
MFTSCLPMVGGSLRLLPPLKLVAMIKLKYCSFYLFQGAQMVLIALFNLNPPEFSMMLSYLPKAFQVSYFILFIVFNTTFSNISAISWRPVLVVEEAGENHRPWAPCLLIDREKMRILERTFHR